MEVRFWIEVDECLWEIEQVSDCFQCQLGVDSLLELWRALVMEIHCVCQRFQTLLESGFLSVELQVDQVGSVGWAVASSVGVLLLR